MCIENRRLQVYIYKVAEFAGSVRFATKVVNVLNKYLYNLYIIVGALETTVLQCIENGAPKVYTIL